MADYYSNMQGYGYATQPRQTSGRPRRRNNQNAISRFTTTGPTYSGVIGDSALTHGAYSHVGRPSVGSRRPAAVDVPGVNMLPGVPPGMPAPTRSGRRLGALRPDHDQAPDALSVGEQMLAEQDAYWRQRGVNMNNLPIGNRRAGPGFMGNSQVQYQSDAAGRTPIQATTPELLNQGSPGYQSEAEMLRAHADQNRIAGSGPYDSGAGRARFRSHVYAPQPDRQQLIQQRQDQIVGREFGDGSTVVRMPNGRNLVVGREAVNEATRWLTPDQRLNPEIVNDTIMKYVNDRASSPGNTEEQQVMRSSGSFVGMNGNDIRGGEGLRERRDALRAMRERRAMTRNRRRFGAVEGALTAPQQQGEQEETTPTGRRVPTGSVAARQRAREQAMGDAVFDGFDDAGEDAQVGDYGSYALENRDNWSMDDRKAFKAGLDAQAARYADTFGEELDAVLSTVEIDPTEGWGTNPETVEWMNFIRSLYGKPPMREVRRPRSTTPTYGFDPRG